MITSLSTVIAKQAAEPKSYLTFSADFTCIPMALAALTAGWQPFLLLSWRCACWNHTGKSHNRLHAAKMHRIMQCSVYSSAWQRRAVDWEAPNLVSVTRADCTGSATTTKTLQVLWSFLISMLQLTCRGGENRPNPADVVAMLMLGSGDKWDAAMTRQRLTTICVNFCPSSYTFLLHVVAPGVDFCENYCFAACQVRHMTPVCHPPWSFSGLNASSIHKRLPVRVWQLIQCIKSKH
jgi:hypothetical protein